MVPLSWSLELLLIRFIERNLCCINKNQISLDLVMAIRNARFSDFLTEHISPLDCVRY